ncbi:MAG: S4 domain-containing protein, partial [Gammaproteobacteria bacterium]|nr:S4 domain-containing protein [Gammaproteobacteria bacterium]
VFVLGFAAGRRQPRQLVRRRYVEVNGRIVDVPSYAVEGGDDIAIKARSRDLLPVQASLESRVRPDTAEWLAVDEKTRVGRVLRLPTRQDVPMAVQEQLIVELYSK